MSVIYFLSDTSSFVEKFITVVKGKSYLPKPTITKYSGTAPANIVNSNNKIPSKAPPPLPSVSALIPPPPPPLPSSITASSNVTNGCKPPVEGKLSTANRENASKLSTSSNKAPLVGSSAASGALASSAVSSSNGLLPPPLPAVAPPPLPSLSGLTPLPLPGAGGAAASISVVAKKDDMRTKKEVCGVVGLCNIVYDV